MNIIYLLSDIYIHKSYEIILVQMGTGNLFIWSYLGYKKERKIEMFQLLWVGRKRSSGFFAACTFARLRGGRENRSGKSVQADRRSVSAWRGLERKGFPTSAGAWEQLKSILFILLGLN